MPLHSLANDPIPAGIISGLIASFIFWLIPFGLHRFKWHLIKKRLRYIFGSDIRNKGQYFIVYAPLIPRQGALTAIRNSPLPDSSFYLEKKLADGRSTGHFKSSAVVPICETRAANYLTFFFQKIAKLQADFIPDYQLAGRDNCSWVSLGGPGSNTKSEDTQSEPTNNLLRMHPSYKFFTNTVPINGKHFKFSSETIASGHDIGVILKISPANFPSKSHISCMGLGEWGTSGAAWFLCNKWNNLIPWSAVLKPKNLLNFSNTAAIIKVPSGYDERACIVEIFYSQADIIRFIDKNALPEVIDTPTNTSIWRPHLSEFASMATACHVELTKPLSEPPSSVDTIAAPGCGIDTESPKNILLHGIWDGKYDK